MNDCQTKVKRWDVIIIGAGVVGCCIAWHLRRQRLRVLVIEAASRPATQSTRFAAGFVGCLSGLHQPGWGKDHADIQFEGIAFYSELAQRTTRDIGFRHVGIAYLFLTDEGWARNEPAMEISRCYGARVELLSKTRAAEKLPFIAFDQVRAAVYLADGIRIRAGEAIAAVAAEAAADGVEFMYNVAVSELLREGNHATGVVTNAGPFYASTIVIAAGAWTQPLLARHGISCPVRPTIETRFTTPAIPGISPCMPMLIFRDWQRFYIREESGGLLIGGGDHLPNQAGNHVDVDLPPTVDRISPGGAHRIRDLLREIEHVMPVLRDVRVGEIGSGLPTFTEDRLFIVDELPDYHGIYVFAGCQEAGVTHGPGLGRRVAEWIVTRRRPPQLNEFRMSRFASSQAT